MLIANPIYDVVFKKLMEDERIAKFFIGTLLNLQVVDLVIKPTEYSYKGELNYDDPEDIEILNDRIKKRYSIWVYRLDYVATIKTNTGELKKVLIEIQKAKNLIDIMRFRNYLAEQYKKVDIIDGVKVVLPITTIYILGFKLPQILTPSVMIERKYRDMITGDYLTSTDEFIEKITHDSFIIQVERITDKYQTRLDKLLSIFEQANFVDDDTLAKIYKHDTDIVELKLITDILHYSCTDPEEKKKIQNEQEAIRVMEALYGNSNQKLAEKEKEVIAMEIEIIANKKIIAIDKITITEKEKEITEKEKEITEKEKEITEKDKELTEKERAILEKEKIIAEQAKLIESLQKNINNSK